MSDKDNKSTVDKSLLLKMNFEELQEYLRNHKIHSIADRLEVAAYLNSLYYGYDVKNPPKLDRQAFSMYKQGEYK